MSRSISQLGIRKVSDLEVGDYSSYPVDRWQYSWIGHEQKYYDGSIIDQFIPGDLIDELAIRLTGKKLQNKAYIVISIPDTYEKSHALAIYRADGAVGIIKLTNKE